MTTPATDIFAPPSPTGHHLPVKPPHHVDSLDGLRAIAVLSVMAVHAGMPGANLGWMGVDIFFALSGFLITTLLVRDTQRTGTISIWRFWVRRFLRLMPAYWLYVGVITALMLGGFGAIGPHGGWTPRLYIASLWGYFVNYAPMGGIWEHQMLTIHLWSLAVEEQFYFLWPGVCWLLLRRRADSPLAAIVAWVAVLAVIVVRHFMADVQLDHLLATRGLSIVMGAAMAFTLQSDAGARAQYFLSLPSLRTLVIGCIFVIGSAFTLLAMKHRVETLFVHRYALPTLSLFFAVLIAMLWYGPRDRLARSLSWHPLVYLGRISYGIYLYHMAAWFLVWGPLLGKRLDHWPHFPKFGLRVSVFFALTIAIASISYYVLERPFLKLKDRIR